MPTKAPYKSSVKSLDDVGAAFDRALASFSPQQREAGPLSSQLINDLKVSFTEAVANASKHAGEIEKRGAVEFTLIMKPRSVIMEVTDHGPGFDLSRVALPKFQAMDESGRGIFIMRQLMDELAYQRGQGRNKLILKRGLPYFSRRDEGLDLLHELSHTVLQTGESGDKAVYAMVLNRIVEAFGVERASVMLYDPGRKRLVIKASVGMAKQVKDDVQLRPGEGIAGFVFQHAKPCVVGNIEKNSGGWERKSGYKSLSLMCAPFFDPQSPQKPLGVINVTERSSGKPFRKKDLKLLTTIANQLTAYLYVSRLKTTMEREDFMRREIEIARHIQQSFLPSTPVEMEGLKLYAWLENASSVGGDLYDVVYRDRQSIHVVLADVSGHNVAAAMNLVNCRGHLRALLARESDPAKVLTELNSLIYEDLTKSQQFISLLLLKINLSQMTLKIACAGHEAPWVFAKNKKPYSLEAKIPSGMLLGLEANATYTSCRLKLKKNTSFLLFTDGLPELRNSKGEILGRKKFYQFLSGLSGDAAKLMESVQHMAGAYKKQAAFQDDVTVLTLDL